MAHDTASPSLAAADQLNLWHTRCIPRHPTDSHPGTVGTSHHQQHH